MILIGLNEGARVYQSFTSKAENEMDNIGFSNFEGFAQDFNVYGNNVNASVGAKMAYSNITRLNKNTISMLFDYIVKTVNVFGKTVQTGGTTTELTNTDINIIDKGSGYSEVQIKTNLNTSLDDIFILVYINGDFGNSYNLIQNLIKCTSNISGDTIDEVENKEIVLTCIDGFIFDEIPTITIGGDTHNFNLNNELTVATVIVDIIDDVIINAVAKANIRVYITGTIVNATCNYVDGELIDINKNIIINANNGFTFKSQYTYTEGAFIQTFLNEITYLIINIDENNTDDIYLNDDYKATKEIEQIGTFVNLYKTNQTELTELSKVRFSENIDYGSYINSLYILPFDIPSDILGDTSTILLGKLDSDVKSTLINNYIFTIDGGTIEIPLKYDNIYDFVNTECILHLPFLDKIYLDTEYVIGQTIDIEFLVELYSSNLTINIRSSFNNEIIESVNGLVGMNIPFMQKANNSVLNSLSNIYKNSINRCFIEVNRNIPYTKNNNVFGGSVVEYGKIGDYEGYLECDSLVLNTKATNQEQEEIKNIIRNGVFI